LKFSLCSPKLSTTVRVLPMRSLPVKEHSGHLSTVPFTSTIMRFNSSTLLDIVTKLFHSSLLKAFALKETEEAQHNRKGAAYA
jgi:hypothetical protein